MSTFIFNEHLSLHIPRVFFHAANEKFIMNIFHSFGYGLVKSVDLIPYPNSNFFQAFVHFTNGK